MTKTREKKNKRISRINHRHTFLDPEGMANTESKNDN